MVPRSNFKVEYLVFYRNLNLNIVAAFPKNSGLYRFVKNHLSDFSNEELFLKWTKAARTFESNFVNVNFQYLDGNFSIPVIKREQTAIGKQLLRFSFSIFMM